MMSAGVTTDRPVSSEAGSAGWTIELRRSARDPVEGEPPLLVAGDDSADPRRLHLDLAALRRSQPAVDADRSVPVRVDPDHDGQGRAVKGDRAALLGPAAPRPARPVPP